MKVAPSLIFAVLGRRIWNVLMAGSAYAGRGLARKSIRRGPDVVRSMPYLEGVRDAQRRLSAAVGADSRFHANGGDDNRTDAQILPPLRYARSGLRAVASGALCGRARHDRICRSARLRAGRSLRASWR